jgi:hypothetical protein
MPAETREIYLLRKVLNGFTANPSSYSVGPEDCFPEKKRLARESDNSFPSGTELKNEWSYNSVFPTPFLDVGSENCILYVAIFSAPLQTDPGAHPASCIMGTGSFPGVRIGRSVTLTPHPVLVPKSKNRVELYLYSP